MVQEFGRNNSGLFRLLQLWVGLSGNKVFPERIIISETRPMHMSEALLGFGSRDLD